jgi:hypothetical protein
VRCICGEGVPIEGRVDFIRALIEKFLIEPRATSRARAAGTRDFCDRPAMRARRFMLLSRENLKLPQI